jgi:hypothetical protein
VRFDFDRVEGIGGALRLSLVTHQLGDGGGSNAFEFGEATRA